MLGIQMPEHDKHEVLISCCVSQVSVELAYESAIVVMHEIAFHCKQQSLSDFFLIWLVLTLNLTDILLHGAVDSPLVNLRHVRSRAQR